MIEIRELAEAETEPFSGLTFPAYRHLLNLQPFSRAIEDPALPESDVERTPVALAAFEGGEPAGLLLAMAPNGSIHQEQDAQHNPHMLSLSVSGAFRRRGIGTALVEYGEDYLSSLGQQHVHGVYTTGKPAHRVPGEDPAAPGLGAADFSIRFGSIQLRATDQGTVAAPCTEYQGLRDSALAPSERL